MKYDAAKHHRHSIRLKGYDYSQAGAYFITICIKDGLHTLGEVCNSQIYLSEPGLMVQTIWNELPLHYPGGEVDAFVVMPDHFHGIIVLMPDNVSGAIPKKPMTLPDVVQRFKSLTTAKYRHGVANGSISIMQQVEILRKIIGKNYVKCKNTLTNQKNMTPEETQ